MDRDLTNTSGYIAKNYTCDLPGKDEIARLLAASARPFVVASDRELSVLRRGLTKEGWKRSLYLQDAPEDAFSLSGTGLLARANQWLATSIEIPERGGSCSDFYCDDGTKLELPVHGSTSGEYRCPGCGKTYSGDKYSAAARWFHHNALANGCLALALVHQIDRDQEYAEKAIEILLSYAKAYPASSTGEDLGGMMDQPQDEAAWIIPLAQSYDLVYHSRFLTPVDRDAVENKLLRQAAQRLAKLDVTGSEASWRLAAVGIVGCALKDAGLLSASLADFSNQIKNELGHDGIWPESVHTHHFSSLSAFIHIAEACSRIGIDLFNYQPAPRRCLKSMFTAPISYAYPSFQLPAINNGPYSSNLPLSLYEIAFRRWTDPVFAWVLRTGYDYSKYPESDIHINHRREFTRSSFYAFLFGRDLPGRVQEPKLVSTNHPGLGICTLRSGGGSMLTFDYGPFLQHGQLDKMGITLYANNKPLCADYGTPGSGSAIADYYKGTFCHNTVVVDGSHQHPTSESRLLEFRQGEYLQIAKAESKEAYPGVHHIRRVMMACDIALVQDTLESDSEHVYDWLLRCEGELCDLPPATGHTTDTPEWITKAISLGEMADFTARWHDGDSGLASFFSMDAPGTAMRARCPAETAARTVPLVCLRRKGKKASYLSLLIPYSGDAPKIACSGNAIKIIRGDTVNWIYTAGLSQNHTGSSNKSEIESDAEMAAVSEVNGEVVCCGLYNGSYVKLRGEPLLMAAGQFDRIEIRLDSRNPIIAFEGASGGYLRLKCHSRAMRVNGHRISATGFDGMATIRLVGVLAGA
ncbi:MAG: heparinase II/III family protein [Armatimonadota bacterium]